MATNLHLTNNRRKIVTFPAYLYLPQTIPLKKMLMHTPEKMFMHTYQHDFKIQEFRIKTNQLNQYSP